MGNWETRTHQHVCHIATATATATAIATATAAHHASACSCALCYCRYPPLYVVDASGLQRPLSPAELLYQQRRRHKKELPYHISRIRRPEEII